MSFSAHTNYLRKTIQSAFYVFMLLTSIVPGAVSLFETGFIFSENLESKMDNDSSPSLAEAHQTVIGSDD